MTCRRLTIASILITLLVISVTPALADMSIVSLNEDKNYTIIPYSGNNNGLEIAELDYEPAGSEYYTPASVFTFWTPTLYNASGFYKVYWKSSAKPVKVVWEFYDPQMHRIAKIKKAPSVIYDAGDGTYYFGDQVEFVIPALFLSNRYGNWVTRCYFIFEDGHIGGDGPIIDESGKPYMLLFVVSKGSMIDLIFNAPIYIFGYKTIPLFWWLSPIWIFLIIILILLIYTRSIKGVVKIFRKAIETTREVKR